MNIDGDIGLLVIGRWAWVYKDTVLCRKTYLKISCISILQTPVRYEIYHIQKDNYFSDSRASCGATH